MDENYYFNNTLSKDLFNLVAGDKISEGSDRSVYNFALNSDLVVKFETTSKGFQNIMEWETWKVVENDKDAKRWFAPCIQISPCGTILLMEKTTPAPRDKYPLKIPAFLTDTKYSNYGILRGKFVCHDYGLHLLMENGLTKRMIKADWWSE